MKIALCGNPNVGKTTLFNRITRSDAPVGNWHGVTVDARSKRVGKDVLLSDLPGAYSLTARTKEETVTRDNILYGGYDVCVYVAEVNNLRRNLYMFVQLLEAGKRVVLVVNMMDEARGKVDLKKLSDRLGVPVVGTSVKSGNPKNEILAAAEIAARRAPVKPEYLSDCKIKASLGKYAQAALSTGLPPEFIALKSMESDDNIAEKICGGCDGSCADCKSHASDDMDYPARQRYAYIDKALTGVLEKPRDIKRANRLDKVLLGKLALPIFLAVMALVFVVTFEAGKPLSSLLSSLTERVAALARDVDTADWVKSLLADGVIAGVGGVLVFLPQVAILYILTALLQDSGYMSRVAFVTDDFFKRFGLSGRAAFSLVLGLGCSVTAVLSTRGIFGKAARRRTAFAVPFCPCSARLAVFTAISGYFGLSGFVVAAMYLLGCAVALLLLKVMNAVKPDRADDVLIMEMPPYRIPSAKRVLSVVWRNVWAFLARVGSTVFAVSIIMWVLCNFSFASGYSGGGETSIMNTFASFIAPVFAPLGFGSWRAVAALITGVAAKETVISVIASFGGMGEVFASTAAAVSFTIFTCLYVPCIATLSALVKENGVKSAFASVAVHTVAAYAASFAYYNTAVYWSVDKVTVIAVWASVAAVAAMIAVSAALVKRRRRRRIAATV